MKVINIERFSKLSDEEVVIFNESRNSILEIFPKEDDNTYSDLTIEYAEKYAFKFTENLYPKIIDVINTKLLNLDTLINKIVDDKLATLTINNTTGNGTT